MKSRMQVLVPLATLSLLGPGFGSDGGGGEVIPQALLVSLNGSASAAAQDAVEFDTDVDGELETINVPEAGAGYAARDANGNGSIDDGSELIGCVSGDGAAELLAFDADDDGWISPQEAADAGLVVWSPGEIPQGGDPLISFGDAGIGYLLAHVVPFEEFDAEECIPFYNGDGEVSGFEMVDPTTFSVSSESLGLSVAGPEGTCDVLPLRVGTKCLIPGDDCIRKGLAGTCTDRVNSFGDPYCQCRVLGGHGPALDLPWMVGLGALLTGASVLQGLRATRRDRSAAR